MENRKLNRSEEKVDTPKVRSWQIAPVCWIDLKILSKVQRLGRLLGRRQVLLVVLYVLYNS